MPSSSVATVAPSRRVRATLRVPGDKSISHRYALLAALARGRSHIVNFAPGADCRSTLTCLAGLGVQVRSVSAEAVEIEGGGLSAPEAPLDAGNSGSTMRMLTGMLAGQPFDSTLVGDDSLSRRPMRRVIEPLTRMGARIDARDGHAPLSIHGTALGGMAFHPDVPSAQVKSAVLLAGLQATGITSVAEGVQTRDHTERALRAFGADIVTNGLTVSVSGRQLLKGQTLTVPGDFSSAAFWMVAAAALPGSRIEILDVGLNPTRTSLLGILRRFGARVETHETAVSAGEPSGTVIVEGDRTGDIDVTPSEVPGLIDELPAIAALAARGGRVSVHGAAELRVKESDRIATLVAGFRGLGLAAEERADGFSVHGSGELAGGAADAKGDHRMAMAFAIAALAASRPSRVEGADSVAISYPGFFETLDRVVA